MATDALSGVLQKLCGSLLRQDGAHFTDGELLEHFIARRDEAAFEALMRRHGPMVLGVCRRILRNEADAEDAFQSTFLVLVRKAASVRPRGLVGNWLYGVAHNTAQKAKAMRLRRQAQEREAAQQPRTAAPAEDWQELQQLLDEELGRLPDKYRAAIVLCDLEGKSIKDAARQLGCPPGTVGTRLARGRTLLARRLARRGLALSGAVIATLLGQQAASASVPVPLLVSTVKTASLLAAGQAAAGVIAPTVAALTEGVIKSMFLAKLKLTTTLLLLFSVLASGATILAYQTAAANALQDRGANTKSDDKAPAQAPKDAKQPAVPRAAEPSITEVKLPAGFETIPYPNFSPDGKKVVYRNTHIATGYHGMAVLDLATNQTVQLVQQPGEEFVVNLVWSPSGDQVAYENLSRKGSSLRVVPASGGKPRIIYASPEVFNDVRPSDWSKDGKWLLAIAFRRDGWVSLLLVPAAGGEPQQLFSVSYDDQLAGGRFSPNGQMIAYSRAKDGKQGHFLFQLADRREIPLVTGPGLFMEPVWSADGRYVLFRRARGEAKDLYAQQITDNGLASEPFLVKEDINFLNVLDDGRLLYTTVDRPAVRLLAAPIDPKTGQLQGKPTVLSRRMELLYPILSPDGQWLAGLRDSELYVTKVDGSQARKVPTDISDTLPLGWFPDGKFMLTKGRKEGSRRIGLFRIDVSSGKAETLFESGRQGYPWGLGQLSPDGKQLAFGLQPRRQLSGLGVMKAEPGANPLLLRRDAAEHCFSPAWSPDGKSIAFLGISIKKSQGRLLVIPAQGGEVKELAGGARDYNRPVWSPNGKFIVYGKLLGDILGEDSQLELWLVSTAGGKPARLDLGAYQPHALYWSADGKTLIFSGTTERAKRHLWAMEKYLPAK